MSDSSSDEEGPPNSVRPKIRHGYESEEEMDPRKVKTPASRTQSRIEWFYDGMTNGKEQVVPCPFVSNDLASLDITQPVKMEDEKGNLLVRSIHEKDSEEEPDDIVIGRWTSAASGNVVELKQFEWNKIGLDFTMVAYGKRRTGKTHFLKALCFQMRRYFPTVIVFTKTKFNGDLLKIFPDAYIYNDMDESRLSAILDAQRAAVGEVKKTEQPWPNQRLLLVFDDVLSDSKNPRYNEMLRKMFFEGRHFWVSFVITSQDSKGLPPAMKQNTDITFILPMQARRDRETVADNSLPFLLNDKDTREFLGKTMQLKHNFLAIVNCRGARPLEEQCYLGIITPESHIPRYVMGSYLCWQDNLDQLRDLGFGYLNEDPRLETWGIETHMPVKPPEKARPDGMGMMPLKMKHKKPKTPLKRADAIGADAALESSKARKTINKTSKNPFA